MDARTLLGKLRDHGDLSEEEAYWVGLSLDGNQIADAQVGAFAMGVALGGLSIGARVALTNGMRDSGDVLTWDLPGPVLDKHSTGGVGDPVSLILAPALAACGAYVPMISGRGLGHTGGTLDKLEAIPGYICDVGPQRLNHVVKSVGCAIVGAGGRVAPSDKRLYAIRDVTGTVKSLDLITASILSKKLAAGLDGLILDVKTGSGAFMARREDARELATSLVDVANGAGCKTSALITDMSQPLAPAAGNAIEVRTVMQVLTRETKGSRLEQVAIALGGQLLAQSPLAEDVVEGNRKIEEVLNSGAAVETFAKMVAALGGPVDFETSWKNCLPEAPVLREVAAPEAGFVRAIDTRALGEAVVALGGGRVRETDRINHAVGLSQFAPLGLKLSKKAPLAMVHAQTEAAADHAAQSIKEAYEIGDTAPEEIDPVLEIIDHE